MRLQREISGVAAGILACRGGRLPAARKRAQDSDSRTNDSKAGYFHASSAGLEARLHVNQDGRRHRAAFTLIEIMLVIGLITIVMSLGVPAIYSSIKKGPMRSAITGVTGACDIAKARAVLTGKRVNLSFSPQQRSYSVEGGAMSGLGPDVKGSGTIDESVIIEMLDVNLSEYKDEERALVRFYPDGTSDEFTLILRQEGNWVKLSLDPTTSVLNIGKVDE